MDQGEAEADGDGGEAFGGAFVGGAEDDEKEERGEEHLDEEAGEERVVFGGVVGVAVGGESAGEGEGGVAAGDQVQNSGGADGSENLGDDVGGQFGDGEAFGGDEADRDGGVEVAAGDVADGEGHGENRESEGKGHADVADAEVNACGEDSAAATAEDKPEGAEGTSAAARFERCIVSPALSCGVGFICLRERSDDRARENNSVSSRGLADRSADAFGVAES
jgi:hypothetical protein